MKKQTILWVALPNGRVGDRLRLSVFVSPRLVDTLQTLGTTTTLEDFPDFLDWPAKQFSFSVRFVGEPSSPLSQPVVTAPIAATRVGTAPRLDRWQALFHEETFVRSHRFSRYDDRIIRSYPARHVMGFLKSRYLTLASLLPTNFPSVTWLTSAAFFGQLGYVERAAPGTTTNVTGPGTLVSTEQRHRDVIEQVLTTVKVVPPGPAANPPYDFIQLKLFHRPRNERRAGGTADDPWQSLPLPRVDFHEAIAAICQYPTLLRELGLVHDLEIPIPANLPRFNTVEVIPTWGPVRAKTAGVASRNVQPKTRCILDASWFIAAPRSSDPELSETGMLKLDNTGAYELIQVDVDGAAIKTMDFAGNLFRAQEHATTDTPAAYSVPSLRSGGLSVARVGRAWWLKGMLERATANNDKIEQGLDLTLDAEDVTRGYRFDVWDSSRNQWYSLCRRRGTYAFLLPETTIQRDDEGFISTSPTQAADGSSTDLYLQEALCRWAGWSLVAPRPGKTIDESDTPREVRNVARTEFPLEVSFTPIPGSLPRLRYGGRYRVRARAADLAGNGRSFDRPGLGDATGEIKYGRFEPVSSPVVLMRKPKTPGESLERLVIRRYATATQTVSDTQTAEIAERHIVPPKVAQLLAEEHGMFDDPATGLPRKDAYQLIVGRESGAFQSDTGVVIKGGAIDPGDDYGTPYFDLDKLSIPYLPDPMAAGAAFTGLPGLASDAVQMLPFRVTGGSTTAVWPGDTSAFRLVLHEDSSGWNTAPSPDETARALHVYLHPGRTARVRISSYLPADPAEIEKMGLWQWIQESPLPLAWKTVLQNHVAQGRHWMFSPFREILLVHAVQQPLTAPGLSGTRASKFLGDTFASFSSLCDVHGASTSQLDVVASWSDPVDALAEPGPRRVTGMAKLLSHEIETNDLRVSLRRQHEFGDTKYRRVTYQAIATTRFAEYFPPGTSPLTRESPVVEQDVLNSARPAAPSVLYVVPAFTWERSLGSNGGMTSRRWGGGLRVYMDRPWYSSGDGEQLGAVMMPAPSGYDPEEDAVPTVPDALKPFVTRFARDPIWRSPSEAAFPMVGHFMNRASSLPAVSLAELANTEVAVAGHRVDYDEVRKLWYCDLSIHPGPTYFPFVRLALARFQPNSVAGAHLSRVVLVDFAQLTPDRLATIVPVAGDDRKLTVSVEGVTYQTIGQERPSPAGVAVIVQERHLYIGGDLDWQDHATFPLTPYPGGGAGGVMRWSGDVTLPWPRGDGELRLVIKEFEEFALSGRAESPTTAWGTRLAYVETVEI